MKRGFLLMNTGSPEVPEEAAVRVYLKEFLMDPHVIDLPRPLRALLVYGLILPRRPAESAKIYKKIWTEKGSPLVHYSRELSKQLNVEMGMTYGSPSFKDAIERLLQSGVDEIGLIPLFPHAAMATTGACIARVKKAINHRATLRVIPPFYAEPAFIHPLAKSLKNVEEHILFSYHGLPMHHIKKMPAPDYRVQCMETTQAIVAEAGISKAHYSVAFQSRLGRTKWMKPYTDERLRQLPAEGKKRLVVICPSFFCDGLETLEEIEIRGKKIFMSAGGESFRMIPCLNDSPAAVQCLETLMAHAANWPIYS